MDLLQALADELPRPGRRYPVRADTWVVCRHLGRDVAATAVNLSDAGACLALGGPLHRGERVEVELLAPAWHRPVTRPGTVAWSRRAGEGVWHAGVRFLQGLGPSRMRDLCRLPHR